MFCLSGALSVHAQTVDWINSSGGTYSTGTNWSPSGVPGAGATIRFNLTNTYSVSFTAPATANALSAGGGEVIFQLGGNTLTLTSTNLSGIGSNTNQSHLRVYSGTFLPGNIYIATTTVNGALTLESGSNTTVGAGGATVVGNGTLTIRDGADLASSGNGARIGSNSSHVGTVTVTGSGSTWNIPATLKIGLDGNGTLLVTNHAVVTASSMEIGEDAGSTGWLNVTGSGATFSCSGTTNIGGYHPLVDADSGTLSVGSGGTVNLNGTTNLRAKSILQMNGGTLNLNTVNLAAGATADWASGRIAFQNASTINAAMIDYLLGGKHTLGLDRELVANTGTLLLDSPLIIDSGSVVAPDIEVDANLTIKAFGEMSADNSIMLEAGKVVQIEDFGTLDAGGYIFNNGASVEMKGPAAWMNGFFSNNFGTLQGTGRFAGGMNIGTGASVRARIGDHIVVDGVGPSNNGRIELTGGTMEYTKTLSNLGPGVISGRGEFRGSTSNPSGTGLSNLGNVNLSGGFSDFRGNVLNTGSGKFTVSGGAVVTLYDGLIHNGTSFKVSPGCSLVSFGLVTGSGAFTGGGTFYFEGGYSPGSSPASVPVAGKLFFGPTSILTMELGGTTPGIQHDQIHFQTGGALMADGVLKVTLIDGFVPSFGDVFQLFIDPATTGSFTDLELPALPPGHLWDTSQLESDGSLKVIEDTTDTDNDSLPDYWENEHFGNLLSSADYDNDGDGTSNLTEYLAGTIPDDASSRLRLRMVSRSGNRATLAMEPVAPGRIYTLRKTLDLQPGSWTDYSSVSIQDIGAERWFTDYDATEDRAFYQVKIEKAP